ncbi:efflux transporter outer membrane subunit [Pseudoxanthomonas dokdonensis]|uniref:RND transporter n=1 Tax=Pseudoxanthomonas dokdonensis TaxID=344882 RepID=A0A0R0CY10_9GAMM|nr:efflux transporter outer membrane subunit [Pseudoxanthomonas dokdonensis]KRG69992.1 RND transporter [Pseudoxanthomonas dokdonensis]
MVRPLLASTLAMALAACVTVGPDYRAAELAPAQLPSANATTHDAAAAGLFSDGHPVSSWWAQFGDPVLDQLIQRSLEANPDLWIAAARIDEARAVFSERRLDLGPHVTAGAQQTRSREPLPDGHAITEIDSVGFDVGWELDLFGRIRRSKEAAFADLQANRNDLQAVQVSVAAEVARNYFELRGAQKQLDVARRTLDNLASTQRLTESRWQLGAGSQLDVQSSLARIKAIAASIPQLETNEALFRNRLSVLAGERPGALDALLQSQPTPAYAQPLPIGDTTAVLRQRPDVRAAERRLAAATARIGVATADLFPRVSLQGFIGFVSGDFSGLVNGDNKAWSVTPSVTWAAFDIGSVRARLRATEAQADGVAAEYEKTVLGALEDTENALFAYARMQVRLKRVMEQATAANRAAELAEVRYRNGASDFLTLLDAQRTALDADDALAQAEADVNVGVVTVYKALGGWGESESELVASNP